MSGTAEDTAAKRAYDSPRRREQAAETRRRIAAAARDLFVERGWAGTRIADVADAAGVAEPTIYATYGTKRGLALALVDAVDAPADPTGSMAELRSHLGDPVAELGVLVGFDRRLFERSGEVIALLKELARSEPDLRAAYEEGRGRGDRVRRLVFSGWAPETFRDGLDAEGAVDVFAALCNVEVFIVLRDERGWSADEIERWWLDSLTRLILREP